MNGAVWNLRTAKHSTESSRDVDRPISCEVASVLVYRALIVAAVLLLSSAIPGSPQEASSSQKPLKLCSRDKTPPCADKGPRILSAEDPHYPEEARKAKLQGAVVLKAVVGTDGIAHDIEVVTSRGTPLDKEAIRCVKNWKFQPGQLGETPVPTEISVEVAFKFHGKFEPGH